MTVNSTGVVPSAVAVPSCTAALLAAMLRRGLSSLRIVEDARPVPPMTALVGPDSCTENSSFISASASAATLMVRVLLVSPLLNVISPPVAPEKSDASVPPCTIDQFTADASVLVVRRTVNVNVVTPPLLPSFLLIDEAVIVRVGSANVVTASGMAAGSVLDGLAVEGSGRSRMSFPVCHVGRMTIMNVTV